MITRIVAFGKELYDSRQVLQELVTQHLILRYRRTLLGYFWTLINPLLMISIMAVVFANLFKTDYRSFAVFLFAGMIPWNFFNAVVTQSGMALINNEGLIKKIYLPKVLFPLSITIALLIDSLLSFAALFILMLALGVSFSWSILFLSISFSLLFMFAIGCGLMISIATLFLRDLQYVISIIMQGLFFLTPILYQRDALSGKTAWLIQLNPVTVFIMLFRAPLVDGTLPGAEVILRAAIIALISITLGLFIFLQQEKKIVFRL